MVRLYHIYVVFARIYDQKGRDVACYISAFLIIAEKTLLDFFVGLVASAKFAELGHFKFILEFATIFSSIVSHLFAFSTLQFCKVILRHKNQLRITNDELRIFKDSIIRDY
ncbi:MAG: hypothetical protein G01um101418_417 [Parcubacteria group bacterium Gr01-1014_18]|nr:MAG: hypothetical protein Greene041636_337 [Parcubacteria group bacterium Greene0416_36]TSC81138.1 MAG: hypothetical protein G01um101418_417 [Parcubacteria group bacterium Gr01-1014_18]TSC98445.1 MAG: hypothetical protein Greene101420_682 [Parcubacteria group bacterium Greene1014_20]TSD07389.1 MAG: hypothetical protein Greene07142_244 [Parcubacteria group bacterium Greene0714_2]